MLSRCRVLTVIAVAWLLGSVGDSLGAVPATPRLPNIVYIITDDLGYGDVHALNPQRGKIPTPHLDKLAGQSMVFTDAHSCSAVCTPSRYGVLTGRYNWRTHLQMGILNAARDPALIAADRLTVPGLLKKHGYHTAGMGKWHLGWDIPIEGGHVQIGRPIPNGPTSRGFDEYACVDVRYFSPYMFTVNDRFVGTPLRNWTDATKGPPTPITDADFADVLPWTTDTTIEYLGRRAADKRPFFAYVAPMVPHSPISVSKQWQGRSGLNLYADYVMELDAEIGRILAAIDRLGLADNTLVMVTSDNGCSPVAKFEELQAKGHYPSDRSRGCKADLWDGGHRIPFLARWPGKVAPGSRCDHPICLTDLMATCAEIVGGKMPDNAGEDSVSILPLLLGKQQPARDSVIHHSMLGKFAIRQGKWKLLLCAGSGCGSKPDDWHAERQGLPKQQLYDMVADPGEQNNLEAKYPEVVEKMTRLLMKQIADGRSTPGKPQKNDVPIDVWKRPDLMSWNVREVLNQKE